MIGSSDSASGRRQRTTPAKSGWVTSCRHDRSSGPILRSAVAAFRRAHRPRNGRRNPHAPAAGAQHPARDWGSEQQSAKCDAAFRSRSECGRMPGGPVVPVQRTGIDRGERHRSRRNGQVGRGTAFALRRWRRGRDTSLTARANAGGWNRLFAIAARRAACPRGDCIGPLAGDGTTTALCINSGAGRIAGAAPPRHRLRNQYDGRQPATQFQDGR